MSSFLENKDFARRYIAETRRISSEAVSEQEVKTCLSDVLKTVDMLIRNREDELDYEWGRKDCEACDILRSTISDQVEYDLDLDYEDDVDLASEITSVIYKPSTALQATSPSTKHGMNGQASGIMERIVMIVRSLVPGSRQQRPKLTRRLASRLSVDTSSSNS